MSPSSRNGILLALIALLLLLPAAAFHGMSGMELRTALFVRDILSKGPSLIPRLDGVPYHDYPPLYFLAAAASSKILGAVTPLSLTLPAVLSAVGTVIILSRFAALASPGVGLMAGLALVTTPLLLDVSSRATVDATLVFFITLALVSYHQYHASGKFSRLLLCCAGLAGGVFTKGPVGATIPIAVITVYLVLARRPREIITSLAMLLIFLILLGALCYGAVAHLEGRDAVTRLVNAQLLDRLRDKPNAPAAYYLGVFFAGFAPWSFFALMHYFRRGARASNEQGDIILFSRVWLLITFLMLSLASIKHSRYLLPASPPMALLCAAWWDDRVFPNGGRVFCIVLSLISRVCVVIIVGVLLFSLLAPFWLPTLARPLTWIIPALCLAALTVTRRAPRDDPRGSFTLLVWSVALGFLLHCQFALPRQSAKEEARTLVAAVERAAGNGPIVLYKIDKDHDGLKFLYWRKGTNKLVFADRTDVIAPPALVIADVDEKESILDSSCGGLQFLFEGRLGKRRCAVFKSAPAIR